MARRLRPVGLEFAGTAPVRLVFEGEMAAAPKAVFDALAEDVDHWAAWFPAVIRVRSLADGTRRDVRLRGGGRFLETVVAAEEPGRYAYRVDVTNAPGVRALLEEWRLTPAGTGTRVRWTVAADGTAPFRFVLGRARPALARVFRGATGALDRRLASR
jgi:uncharacterized protein YndB with AHSA1/START domain